MSSDQAPWPAPRYLLRSDITPRVGSDPESIGYTELAARAMFSEPEPLDEAEWRAHVRKRADQAEIAERMQREKDAKLLSQEERIVKAQKEAAVKRRDVSRELWMLRRMQQKKMGPAVIEKRVQHLERVVYLGRAA